MLPKYKEMGLIAHNGIDFVASRGEPILWNGYDVEGRVVKLSTEPNEGLGVVVITEDEEGRFKHIFWHLKEIKCKVGQKLSSGDLIGTIDSTGFSTGDHLHWGLKRADKNNKTIDYNNGYKGAIDPEKYFTNIYIGDTMNLLANWLLSLKKLVELIKGLNYKPNN
jgi:murein DD-endopeptidase MepM/ murein hydrolase activator NlpD